MDEPMTAAGRALYRWFRGHDDIGTNRLDAETATRILAIEREAARPEVAEPGDGWCVECGETWPCRGVRAPTKADRAIPHRMAADSNRG